MTDELIKSVIACDREAVKNLLKNGANANAPDSVGDTALSVAIELKNIEMLIALLAGGANVNSQSSDGQTALMLACNHVNVDCKRTQLEEDNSVKIVNLLLIAGADVHLCDMYGNTALHATCYLIYGAKKQALQKVKLLLEMGVDVNAQNCGAQTARMIAELHNQKQIASVLQKAEKATNKGLTF